MTKVGEHVTLDIIGTTKEYDPSVYEKVIKDIAKAILIFVRSERTEKKVLNISSDICDKHSYLSVLINLINIYQKSAMIFVWKTSA